MLTKLNKPSSLPQQQQPTQPQTTEQKPVAQDNKAPAAQQQPAQSQTTQQKPVVQDNKAPAAQQPAQPQTTEQKPVVQQITRPQLPNSNLPSPKLLSKSQ